MDWKNNFGTTTFEGFMKRFFGETFLHRAFISIHYFNRRIVIPIGTTVNAEIKLIEQGVSGTYAAFLVTIIHKTNGTITRQTFSFKDWLKLPNDHTDRNQGEVGIIEHCGKDWYLDGPTPESITNLVAKITEYIKLYQ